MTATTILCIAAATTLITLLLAWSARRAMFAFEVRIKAGRVTLYSGRARAGFVADVQEIVDRNGIARGKVRGIGLGRAMRLSFAGAISDQTRQQMRNAWSLLR